MNHKIVARTLDSAAIAGVVVSASGLLVTLGRRLSLSEFSLSIASLILALLIGIFSVYVAKVAKKLTLSRRVFISYSHADELAANEVAEAFRRKGARVWLDKEMLKPGESIRDAVEKGIEDADTFVVLLSEQPKGYMLLELRLANSKGIPVIPVLLSDSKIPSGLKGLRYIDLRHEKARGLEELVSAAT